MERSSVARRREESKSRSDQHTILYLGCAQGRGEVNVHSWDSTASGCLLLVCTGKAPEGVFDGRPNDGYSDARPRHF